MAERAGRLDVDQLLDTIAPEEFDEWIAFKHLEPDKLDRLRVILTTGLLALCNSWGCKIEPKDLDPLLEDQEDQEAQEVSPDQAVILMKAAFGGAK